MEVSVRQALGNDYDALGELFDEIDTLHRDSLPHLFQKPSGPARAQDYYLGLLADEKVGFFVAITDEKLVGFVHALVTDMPALPVLVQRRSAFVNSLVVKSGFQKHGIGSILMEKVQEWAVAKGATSIELNVYEFNETAISFYERLGYQTFSRKMSKELKRDQAAG